MEVAIDTCGEIVKSMVKLGFSEKSIDTLKNSNMYQEAVTKDTTTQKAILTMLFYNIIMYKGPVPTNIRLGLHAASDVLGWLEDMTGIVLPFIRVNEDVFFN